MTDMTFIPGKPLQWLVFLASSLLAISLSTSELLAQDASETAGSQCAVLELFIRNDCADCTEVQKRLEAYSQKRGRINLHVYNLDEPGKHVKRYQQILKYFQLQEAELPVAYGCNSLLRKLKPDTSTDERIDKLLTVDIYVRSGCSRCAAAKVFLKGLKQRYPVFEYNLHDVVSDSAASTRVYELADRYGKQAVSVPVFHFCNQLVIGWISDEYTGSKVEDVLKYWTATCPKPEKTDNKQSILQPPDYSELLFVSYQSESDLDSPVPKSNDNPVPLSPVPKSNSTLGPPPVGDDDALPPVPGGDASLPPPPGDMPPPLEGEPLAPVPSQEVDSVEVPFLGELSKSRLGMPAFTFLIGLVDGFNPCAMWVLLFLLSLLVNLKNRAKVLAVAGTFVLISGLAYYAFMAAWLNVFLLIGYLPMVQFLLGLFAVIIGLIHIKDFFAFKKGISLSIPEWAKPGLYARARKIVNAENLTGAILGASILAVLVNIIELLCTAGLPALYTEVLTMQNYPAWKTYSYLGLYIVAYMLDDAIMVTIVVVTMGRHKLQENQGRWLKLFSGVVILLLGLVLIFKPSLLH
ncbi:hypothetical protein Mal35_31680 [Gimesia maris]|uniref:glutaredoxin family protein n=1 Tax=Gimesia maris TaxID=122 RepID=UPI0011878519|nr:hypothetical protein [Gimesia maris]QDT79701.1 hypothetical protein Mal35_31680 [Gimesia maris]